MRRRSNPACRIQGRHTGNGPAARNAIPHRAHSLPSKPELAEGPAALGPTFQVAILPDGPRVQPRRLEGSQPGTSAPVLQALQQALGPTFQVAILPDGPRVQPRRLARAG